LEVATGRRGSAPWRAGREPRATEAARLAARGARAAMTHARALCIIPAR